jgi:adenylate cyclase
MAASAALQPSLDGGILAANGAGTTRSGMAEEQPKDTSATPSPVPEHGLPSHHHAHPHLPAFKFLEELKRRNVGRVAILYIILGYVVLEIFGVFVHLLDLPPWVGRSAVLLVVLGFPVALLIAWICEITPEGLKPTEEVAPHQSIRHLTGRRLDRAIIAVLAIALTYFVVDKFWLSTHAKTPRTVQASAQIAATTLDHSIAVLPFLDMSEKKDQEYFADGMAEELLDLLSRIPELRVIARTSSFSFKGKSDDIRTIATKLGVANLLEGSVRKSGNTLRVTAQLIRATDGAHIWSKTYDRKTGDIFKVQDDIASAVVEALKVSLLSGAMPKATGTGNFDAYSLTMQARMMFLKANNREDFAKVDEYLHRSLQLDPRNVQTWAVLASVRFTQANLGVLPDGWSEARAWREAHGAAQTAIQLDPSSEWGHTALAYILFFHDWDWSAADEQIQLILATHPNDDWALGFAGFKYWILGNVEKAIPYLRKATDRDPLNDRRWAQLAEVYRLSGQLEKAQDAVQKALQVNPGGAGLHAQAAFILLSMGNPAAAQAEIDKEVDNVIREETQTLIYCRLGKESETDRALEKFEKTYSSQSALGLAEMYACKGNRDLAFQWLDRAYLRHEVGVAFIKTNDFLGKFRGDPRWAVFLRKMKLPE